MNPIDHAIARTHVTLPRRSRRPALALALYAFSLEVAIVGVVPGVSDPDTALLVCWSALLAMLAALFVALVGASVQGDAGTATRHSVRASVAHSR
jgi:hypothetical protein